MTWMRETTLTADRTVAVELTIADKEPVASFVADAAEALDVLSALSADELAGCPAAVAAGIAGLRAAVSRLAGSEPRKPEWRGHLVIEWPPPSREMPVPGPLMAAFEVDPLGKHRPLYATRITIRALPDEVVSAEVEAVVDDYGRPIPEGCSPVITAGELPVRTFRYAVAEMRVRGKA